MSENKRIFGVAGGAISMSGLAAVLGTCCVAPGMVALLGVSGAVTLARLARFQPYFLVAAALMLGIAFYWVYRADPNCVDGSCEATSRRRLRIVVWIAAAFVVALAALSFVPAWWPIS